MPGTLVTPAFKVNVELVMVAGFIALLNAAVTTAELGQIGVTLFGGVTSNTEGGVVAHDVEVVKVHAFSAAKELPSVFAAPVAIVAVNVVLGARLTVGVKVAVWVATAYDASPATLAPPGPVKVNVEELMVAGFIA